MFFPKNVRPLPKTGTWLSAYNKGKNRRRQTAILTNTPEKRALECENVYEMKSLIEMEYQKCDRTVKRSQVSNLVLLDFFDKEILVKNNKKVLEREVRN